MKILIIKLSSIGDVVHTLPSLAALRKGYASAGKPVTIDWLVEEAASDIIKGHPLIDEVKVVKKNGWLKDFNANRRVARKLREAHYDLVLDFQGLFKSAIWVWLSRGKKRVGFSNSRELSHLSLTEKLPAYDPEMHAVDRYLKLSKHAGGEVGDVVFPFHTGEEAENNAASILRSSAIDEGEQFVTIVPGARWRTKLWTSENFAQVAARIRDEFGLKVLLIGGLGDFEELEKISRLAGDGVVNLAGRTGLAELAVLLGHSSLALTVDSGPMHIAAAVGTPVVALFGSTAPWRTGPYGAGHVIIRKELSCSPCFKRECGNIRCMNEITVDEVFKAASGLMAFRRRRKKRRTKEQVLRLGKKKPGRST